MWRKKLCLFSKTSAINKALRKEGTVPNLGAEALSFGYIKNQLRVLN
jgi:hypothetical protein